MFAMRQRILKPRSHEVEIDCSHPLASRLAFVALFGDGNLPVDFVRGIPGIPTANPSTVSFAVAGQGAAAGINQYNAGANSYFEFANFGDAPYLGDLAIVWRGVIHPAGIGQYNHFVGKHFGNGATDTPFDFRTNNQNPLGAEIVRSNASGFTQVASGVSLPTGVVTTIGVDSIISQGSVYFFLNGASSGNVGSPPASVTGAGAPIRVGRRADNAVQLTGAVHHIFIWSRFLTEREHLAMHLEPYQIFKPRARRIYSFSSSSGVSLSSRGFGGSFGRAGFSGAAPIASASRRASFAKSGFSGSSPLAGSSKSAAIMRAAMGAAAALAAKEKAQSSAKASFSGATALSAKTTSQSNAKTTLSATALLFGLVSGRSFAKLTFSGTLNLFGRSLSAGFARAVQPGSIALFARSMGRAVARAGVSASATLSARSSASSTARALAKGASSFFARSSAFAWARSAFTNAGLRINPNLIATASRRVRIATASARSFIAVAQHRRRVVVGVSNQMAQTNDLQPPMDATVELETVTFDFGKILASGVTITSVISLAATVYSGADAAPNRFTGSQQIGASPSTGAPSAAVSQLFGQALAGVTYRLQCVVQTSDGQKLSLWNHLVVQAPN